MSEISKKALSEAELLKEIYKKLAGDNPTLDLNKAQSKATLLRAIADLEFGSGSKIEIVQDIPTILNPGQRVWCVATQSEWIGAYPANGIFPTLASGVPFPVKGYKEFVFKVKVDANGNVNYNTIIKNEINVLSSGYDDIGIWFISFGNINTNRVIEITGNSSVDSKKFFLANIGLNTCEIVISSVESSYSDFYGFYSTIKEYPPESE